MATTDDLTDQLALTTKIAAQMQAMSESASVLEKSYATQVDSVKQLAAVFGQLNTGPVGQGIDVINKALISLQGSMKDTGKASDAAFKKLGKNVDDTGKNFAQKFPKSIAIGIGALEGFTQGVRDVVALGKGVSSFAAGFVDGLANITLSILSIPLKIFEGLVDMAAKSATGSNELMQALEDLRKQFGAFTGPTNKAIIDVTKSMQGFSDTGLSTWRVFGNMADRLKSIGELAKEMGGSFGKLRKEFEDNGGAILAFQKGLGILNEDMKGVTLRSVAMGAKTSTSLKDMTKYSLALGDAFGLDAKLISRDMSKALTDVKHFGGATVKQIAEASTYARKLGFELKDITGTLDAFDTFDTAAENVAKLSQAFGVQIDAFDLMSAQSPAEQIDMLRKSFARAGVDAGNFNRAQLKLVASTTGLDEGVVQSALSLKNQGASMDQIKKKSAEAEKKTLTQADAMAKLASAIERMVQSGGGLEGGFWDTFVKGIKNGIFSSKEFVTLMMNIRRALQDTYFIGVKLGRDLVKIVPGFKDILGGLSDFFQPKYFDKLFQGISNSVRRFFDPNSTDKGSIPRLVEGLQKTFREMFTSEGSAGKKILDGFKKFFTAASRIAAAGIDYMGSQIADGIKYVTDLLTGKETLNTGGLQSAGKGGLGFVGNLLGPIVKSLQGAWKTVQPALYGLLDQLAKMAWQWVVAHQAQFIKIGEYVLGYIFAKSLVGAAVGLLTDVVLGAAVGVLKAAAGGILRKVGADVLANMFTGAETSGITKAASATLNQAFSKVSATGADIGSKIGSSAIGQMTSKVGAVADGFAQKLGASGFGSSLGAAAGIAAAAYIAIEGKKLIDETFEKGHKADTNLRGADLTAFGALSSRTPIEKKLEAIKSLQDTIAAQQATLNDKGFGEKALNWVAGTDVAADQAADALAKSQATLQQLQDQVTKASVTGALGIDEVQKKAAAAAKANTDFFGASTLDDAKGKLATLEDFAKKIKGNGFDVNKVLDDVKSKFAGVDFNFITPDQTAALQASADNVAKLTSFTDGLLGSVSSLNTASKALTRTKNAALGAAVTAVTDMVAQANALNDALSGGINKIDIKAKLGQVAGALGLGGKASYTVNPSKEVRVTVNMTVTMNVDEVEKVILLRKGSIIKDRLDFATATNVGQTTPVPLRTYTPEGPTVPLISTGS